MNDRRADNESLRALLAAADWTYEALARAVNTLGAENGLRLHYDRTSVAHWLAGSVPRPQARDVLAEALTRRLGRPVTLADLGMADRAAHPPGTGPPDPAAGREPHALARLLTLCEMDADPARRTAVQQAVYTAEGLDVAPWRPDRGAPATGATGAGAREAAELRTAVAFFDRAGDLGGRYARTALIAYLHDDVVPRLHAALGSGGIPPVLLTESARLTCVLARMYVDDAKNGAAQHYHRVALQLAAEAGDRAAYAVVLRGMGAHALDLGHSRAALRLCEAAARTVPVGGPDRVRAYLLSGVALARAAEGRSRHATEALDDAERYCLRACAAAPEERDPLCDYSWASFLRAKGRTLALLGDRPTAIAALRLSLDHRPASAHRSRAHTHAELARLLLRGGLVDEAGAGWHGFLDEYAHLRSGRADHALAELRRTLRVHSGRPAMRALLRRAAEAARHASG
ncbi:hypothetical protein [Streptomyces sp. NPDC003077]|uniref:hypothetical protein n=1 Tax=Streptomyces sp. NPDC003077 TaxID=3154443 RepID=UPI0033B947E6